MSLWNWEDRNHQCLFLLHILRDICTTVISVPPESTGSFNALHAVAEKATATLPIVIGSMEGAWKSGPGKLTPAQLKVSHASVQGTQQRHVFL